MLFISMQIVTQQFRGGKAGEFKQVTTGVSNAIYAKRFSLLAYLF